MKYIAHRKNTIHDLINTPHYYGVEVDVRSQNNKLIIHHDPFVDGEDFEAWISNYSHGTLILNIKEEGLESRLLELMNKYEIEDFFFLDQSIPFLVKLISSGENRTAVRFSEYESLETVLNFEGKVKWVWVDCFTMLPLDIETNIKLKKAGFKLCLVSPELQGRLSEEEIHILARKLLDKDLILDAICTKRIDLWEQALQDF